MRPILFLGLFLMISCSNKPDIEDPVENPFPVGNTITIDEDTTIEEAISQAVAQDQKKEINPVAYISLDLLNYIRDGIPYSKALQSIQDNNVPGILDYNKTRNTLFETWNYHEGGIDVDIKEFTETIEYKGMTFLKINVEDSVQRSISSVMLEFLFGKNKYQNKNYILEIKDNHLYINETEYEIVINIVGAANELHLTVLMPSFDLALPRYAIKVDEFSVHLTKLRYEDGPIGYRDGEDITLN